MTFTQRPQTTAIEHRSYPQHVRALKCSCPRAFVMYCRAHERTSRGLAGLGRIRALLRLGKRPHAGPPRCPVLAPRGGGGPRSGAGTGVWYWPRLRPAGKSGRRSGGHRSLRAHARPPAGGVRPRRGDWPRERRARRHSRPPVRRPRVFDGARALRGSAIACSPIAIWSPPWRRSPVCWPPAAGSASTSCPTCQTGVNTTTRSSCEAARPGDRISP